MKYLGVRRAVLLPQLVGKAIVASLQLQMHHETISTQPGG
jgi:hypothetical protein